MEVLSVRGVSLESLGTAYLFLVATALLTSALYTLSRMFLVVTPNRAARHYGLYVVMVLVSLAVASVLENELAPQQATALHYSMLPQLLLFLTIHLWIYYDQQPWLIALGAAGVLANVIIVASTSIVSNDIHVSQWLTFGVLIILLGYLCYHSISTKRGFTTGQSIYTETKSHNTEPSRIQKPWLGLPQWVALTCASLVLAMANASLQGSGIAEVPAVSVLATSAMMLSLTTFVCAIPATTYWLAHKHWMPELTRFTWLVWLVVGFAFSYGNFLGGFDRF